MRLFFCLILLSSFVRADDVSTVRLAIHSGFEYFSPTKDDCDVRLLNSAGDAVSDFDYGRGQFAVPYGWYTLSVEAPGFRTYQRLIHVVQPQVDLLVVLRLSDVANYMERPPPSRLEGRVTVATGDPSKLWVRVQPLFGTSARAFDSRLDDSGQFSLALDKSTDFLILVFAPESDTSAGDELRVAATQQVRVHWNRTTAVTIAID